jgi:hypothetical protein
MNPFRIFARIRKHSKTQSSDVVDGVWNRTEERIFDLGPTFFRTG